MTVRDHFIRIPISIAIIKRCNQQFYWATTFGLPVILYSSVIHEYLFSAPVVMEKSTAETRHAKVGNMHH